MEINSQPHILREPLPETCWYSSQTVASQSLDFARGFGVWCSLFVTVPQVHFHHGVKKRGTPSPGPSSQMRSGLSLQSSRNCSGRPARSVTLIRLQQPQTTFLPVVHFEGSFRFQQITVEKDQFERFLKSYWKE